MPLGWELQSHWVAQLKCIELQVLKPFRTKSFDHGRLPSPWRAADSSALPQPVAVFNLGGKFLYRGVVGFGAPRDETTDVCALFPPEPHVPPFRTLVYGCLGKRDAVVLPDPRTCRSQ